MRLAKLEVYKVISNPRFILFTIFLPLLFFVVLEMMNGPKTVFSVFSICLLYGLIGNTLVTQTSRVSREFDFYSNIYVTTDFNLSKNSFVLLCSATFINGIITVIMATVGILFFRLTINLLLLKLILSYFIILIPLSFLSVCLGTYLHKTIVPIVSNLLYFLIVFLGFPNSLFVYFPKLINNLRRFTVFPFMWDYINSVNAYKNLLIMIGISLVFSLVLIILPKLLKKILLNSERR